MLNGKSIITPPFLPRVAILYALDTISGNLVASVGVTEYFVIDLVIEIIRKSREKGISFGQATEILAIAQAELQKLPLS